jgi:hypothetical protein
MKRHVALSAAVGAGVVAVLAVVAGMGLIATGGTQAGTDSERVRIVEGDVDYVQSLKELVSLSTLIVYGEPIGQPSFAVGTETGVFGDYTQSFNVVDVIKGEAPSEISVARLGMNEAKANEGVDRVEADALGGPLPPGAGMLFLQPSLRPGTYSVVGHTQGTLSFGADGRAAAIEHRGFETLRGLTLDEVRTVVAEVRE